MTNQEKILPAAKRMYINSIEADASRRASNALRGWFDVGSHQIWLDEDQRIWTAFCILRAAAKRTAALR